MNTNQSTANGTAVMSAITVILILLVSGFLIPDAWLWLFTVIVTIFTVIGDWFAHIGQALIYVVTLRWL